MRYLQKEKKSWSIYKKKKKQDQHMSGPASPSYICQHINVFIMYIQMYTLSVSYKFPNVMS